MAARARMDRPRTRRGFTLVEAAVATIIIGVGIIAVMQLGWACTRQNRYAAQMTSAALLATHIREILEPLPFSDPQTGSTTFGPESGETTASYDDIDDFHNLTFSPPIDVYRNTIPSLSNFSQRIYVWPVNRSDLAGNVNGATIPTSTYTGAVRITVQILYSEPGSGKTGVLYEMSWVKTDDR